jgi:hypothetical protein
MPCLPSALQVASRLALGAALTLAALGCAPPGSSELAEEELALDEDALETATIRFAADWSETVDGELRAGASARIVFDPARLPRCRGTQGGIPQWSIGASWLLRGTDGSEHRGSGTVAGLNAGSPVVVDLPVAGELSVWFELTDRWGCHEYDSNFGEDYVFDVGGPEGAPGWVGNAASVISRATCDGGYACEASRVPLENGFRFDTWARQRAAIAGVYFDVWEEGVTDRDDAEIWREVDAQVHVRFDGQEATTMRYADFLRRVGNDARFELRLRTIDPFHAMPSQVPADGCPDVALELSEDGFYVRTSVEITFSADGVDLAPASGSYVGVFEDYASPYAACL